jgi:hypothetical protein
MRRAARQAAGTNEPYLKARNTVYLWSFVSINIAVFLCLLVSKALTESSVDYFWHRVTMKDGIVVASIPILAIVLSGMVGDLVKARLVFWRWENPLPGCRVFTELLTTDHRIDVAALQKKLGDFPHAPKAQNALWFTLYRRHSAAPRVLEGHRIYLLTRDMAAISALFVVLLSLGVFAGSVGWKITALYAAALFVQYLLVANSARNYGKRFVLNVLSEESHD